ncbi:conserved hypothetical protein [Vibrio parahaemolyticus K5030]|nr:conserved hypothetical protein [Vibrio parahaemolyticus K5030]
MPISSHHLSRDSKNKAALVLGSAFSFHATAFFSPSRVFLMLRKN